MASYLLLVEDPTDDELIGVRFTTKRAANEWRTAHPLVQTFGTVEVVGVQLATRRVEESGVLTC